MAMAAVEYEISRRDLRPFHTDVSDLLVTLINRHGVKFKMVGAAIMLYPPDGSNDFLKVSPQRPARDSERFILAWAGKHIHQVAQDQVVALAEKLNSPEHKVEVPKPAPPKAPVPKQEPSPSAWQPHVTNSGNRNTGFEFRTMPDGSKEYRCIPCREEGKRHVVTDGRAISGHRLTVHEKESAREKLWGPAAEAKKASTRKERVVLSPMVEEAHRLLSQALGIDSTAEVTELRKEVERLKATIGLMEVRVKTAESERDEATARLALIQEAMRA